MELININRRGHPAAVERTAPIYHSTPYRFPDPRTAPPDAPLACGGDLGPERLLAAYAQGIFPWYQNGEPIFWWSPDPRMVLYPEEVRVSRSLAKSLRKPGWTVTADEAFPDVIRACASTPRPGQEGTWITDEMVDAYLKLHRMGYAHSIEVWWEGALAGGLYGISLGSAFFGESMFHLRPDASKIALVWLAREVAGGAYSFVDCQMPTRHLARLGARRISRRRFLYQLSRSLGERTRRGKWTMMDPTPLPAPGEEDHTAAHSSVTPAASKRG